MIHDHKDSGLEKGTRAMAFPEVRRVVYEINPLEEVICQLRFPPILKIDAAPPVDFQERIRPTYPFYKTRPNMQLALGVSPDVARLLSKELPFMLGQLTHEFGSTDEQWTLTLTREFLGLTCKRYDRWEGFRARLNEALMALVDFYTPNFFVRIGLRYKNVIRRSKLGLGQADWSELLNDWIVGAYSSRDIRNEIEMHMLQMQIRLQDGLGRVLVSCGVLRDGQTNEECYLIDADFFIDTKVEPSHALERLDFLNIQSDRFFRWCIRDRLHSALLAHPRVS